MLNASGYFFLILAISGLSSMRSTVVSSAETLVSCSLLSSVLEAISVGCLEQLARIKREAILGDRVRMDFMLSNSTMMQR